MPNALLLLPLALVAAQEGDEVLTLEQASGRGEERVSFREDFDGSWDWAWDGEHLEHRKGEEVRWFDPASGDGVPVAGEPEDPAEAEERAEEEALRAALAAAVGEVAGLDEEAGERVVRALAGGRAQVSEDGSVRVASARGALWAWTEGAGLRRLADDEDVELVDLAPDGARVAFVRGNDLAVVDTATGVERAITTNGSDERFNGKLDWVYQEEIYGRGDFKAFWWSPDSAHVAFLSLDEEPVYEFTVVDHVEEGHFRVEAEVSNYPKVGDPNPIVSVGLAEVASGSVAWMDLDRYAEDEPLVVRVSWTPDGERALVCVQDRIQTWAELLAVDPATGADALLIREESEAWTERPDEPRWLEDGTFLWRSHRTGTDHLYRYRRDGRLVGAVTSGDWNLRRVVEIDEESGTVWFTTTDGGDIGSQLGRASLDGGAYARVTRGPGTHRVSFDDAKTFYIDRVSRFVEPTVVRLCRADGTVVRELDRATIPAAATYRMPEHELHRVAARDGYELDVSLVKPVPFDPERSYPVWITTYSGPAAPSVRDRWTSSAYTRFLAQQGVIVMQCNVRSATSRGHRHTAAAYERFGLPEVRDMSDAVRWLTSHPWADAERVGITGYSYGGFMTASCLTRTDLFALGIAGGGVYDWRMYDTIYTERYMSTPDRNPEGYAETSCLEHAGDLTGFLHMHHGVMDDNVHVQNLMQMAYALQKAEKTNWSMMAYPQTRHGIRDRSQRWHARQLEWDLIREHLRPPGPSPSSQ